MLVYTLQRRVDYADTDMAGIVHVTAFFRYQEQAEHAYLRAAGVPVIDPAPRGIGWLRVSCAFDFLAPLRFGDEIEVRLHVVRVGRSTVRFRTVVVRDGQVVARGRCTTACCRMDARGNVKAVAIPAPLRRRLARAA